jgi:predicted phage gp36 major capsid-like protein
MNVEFIPHVFDGNGVPKGQRGWLAWARVGADSVDDNGFRLLQNA